MGRFTRTFDRFISKKQLGAVLSTSSLRLALITRRGSGISVDDVAEFQLPAKFDQGSLNPILDSAAREISHYLRSKNLDSIPVNICILSDDFAFRRILFPDMPAKEIKEAIYWEAEKAFPFDISECNINYRVFDAIEIRGKRQRPVNIIAAPVAIMDLLYEKWEAAGNKMGDVAFAPAILADAAKTVVFRSIPDNYLLLSLDHTYSYVLFVENGDAVFFQRLSTVSDLSSEEQLSETVVADLRLELQSVLDMFGAFAGSTAPGLAFVVTSTGQSDLVCAELSRSFEMTFRPLREQTEAGRFSGHLTAPDWDRFLDAILTAAAPVRISDLAPESRRRAGIKTEVLRRTVLGSALVLFILCGLTFQQYHAVSSKRTSLAYLEDQIEQIENSPAYAMYINIRNKLQKSAVAQRGNSPGRLHLALKELSRTIPKEVNFTSLWLNRGTDGFVLNISGDVTVVDFSPEIILASYVEQLNESALLREVKVTSHAKEAHGDRFILHFVLQMDAAV